jgi:hypothetical protein
LMVNCCAEVQEHAGFQGCMKRNPRPRLSQILPERRGLSLLDVVEASSMVVQVSVAVCSCFKDYFKAC